MNSFFLILLMIFCHIVDDYYLQGWLASAKQSDWWKKNSPSKLYEYDYLCALTMHSFSWSFMIMLPAAFQLQFNIPNIWYFMFIINFIIHMIVDNEKANRKTINLWVDQIIHFFQIIITGFIFVVR